MLSINRACLQTTWIRLDGCQQKGMAKTADGMEEIVLWPSRKCFRDLLVLAALRQTAVINKFSEETSEELAKIFSSGKSRLALQTLEHLSDCSLCGSYFKELSNLIGKYLPQYIQEIRNKQKMVPVTEDTASELVVPRRSFVMNQTGKPS